MYVSLAQKVKSLMNKNDKEGIKDILDDLGVARDLTMEEKKVRINE